MEDPQTKPRIFISYSHEQLSWVKNDLVALLEAGGAEVIVDYKKFEAGKRVVGQMDKWQDSADTTLCVLTPAYCKSDYCMHELQHAMDVGARRAVPAGLHDTEAQRAVPEMRHSVGARRAVPLLPVIREPGPMPDCLKGFDSILRVDLTNPERDDQWDMLLNACNAAIGTAASQWLTARNDITRYLERGTSVNLVVIGKGVAWRGLLKQISRDGIVCCKPIDLGSGGANTRHALIEEILHACNIKTSVPDDKDDLVILHRELCKSPSRHILVFTHFDMVRGRQWYGNIELFSALRHLVAEEKNLVLLIQSRKHFVHLLPKDNPLSSITNLVTVELRAKA